MGFLDRFRRKRPAQPVVVHPSPRDLFLEQVLTAARTNRVLDNLAADPARFAITGKVGDKDRTLFLDNLFAETRDVPPEDRPDLILNFLNVVLEPDETPVSFAAACHQLVSVVRSATYWSLPGADETLQPVVRAFAPFLVEAAVLDGQHTMSYVTATQLAAWKATPQQVFEAAHATLSAAADVGIELYDQGPPTIWHVASDDSYESSRLLLPGWLAAWAGKVRGRPIAAIPHRSMLLVAGDADPGAIERLLASAEAEFGASPRCLSPALYTVDDAGLVVTFQLPADHPLYAAVKTAHIKLAMYEYNAQKERLEAQHERDGTDIFIATYTAIKFSSGAVVSHCVWGENIDSLLPRTDLVAFIRKDEPSFMVPWNDVERIVGDCWSQAPMLEPPRMRTLRWPDDAVLVQLRNAAVDPAESL